MRFPTRPTLAVAAGVGLLLAAGPALAIGATAPTVQAILPADGSLVPKNFHLFPVGDGLDGTRHLVRVHQGETTLFEAEMVPARGGGRVVELPLPEMPPGATLQIEGAVDTWESGDHWQLELRTTEERDDEAPVFPETLGFSACLENEEAGLIRVEGSFEPAVESAVVAHRLYQLGDGGRRDLAVTLAAGAPPTFWRHVVNPALARDCYVLQAVDVAGNESANEASCFDFDRAALASCSPGIGIPPTGEGPPDDPGEGGAGCSAAGPSGASLLAAAVALAGLCRRRRRVSRQDPPSSRAPA